MFTKALIATDLSAASFAVIRGARCLQSLGVKECLLVQCLNMQDVYYPVLEAIREHLDTNLSEQQQILEEFGFKVTKKMVLGYAKTEINRLASERDCQVIVVGTQGQSLVGTFLLGGVAAAVIHHATLPVLLIPVRKGNQKDTPEAQVSDGHILRHVLFPTDFSDFAKRAFTCLIEIANQETEKITLFHVQDRIRIEPHLTYRLDEFNQVDENRLTAMRSDLNTRVHVAIKTVFGHPSVEILNEIEEGNVSMVVMGSRGRGFVGEVFLGSVSHNVARKSPVPVLIITQ